MGYEMGEVSDFDEQTPFAGITLRCVDCYEQPLIFRASGVVCDTCGRHYRTVGVVPIFLRSDNEIFPDFGVQDVTRSGFRRPGLRRLGRRLLPSMGLYGRAHQAKMNVIESYNGADARCLVIGAGDNAVENRNLRQVFSTTVVTDVSANEGVHVVCDGHDLPFAADQFDFVILTAVLEHVLDPSRVVAEVSRVLKAGGTVYAVTPFMQQVHMGAYDYTRFTDLGHRWLFRNFVELDRGSCGGPGTVLGWALIYFFSSLVPGRRAEVVMKAGARLMFGWVKYLDVIFAERGPASDAASGFFFIGRNEKRPMITATELLASYRGRAK